MTSLRCGYCAQSSVAWIEWSTIGRPKGAPVCETHLYEIYQPDNFGEYPTVEWNAEYRTPGPENPS